MNIFTTFLPIFFGGLLGFGWHKLVGCRSGACLLTANPYLSTLYGAFLGFLMGVKI
jgi:hypothetical protein